MVLSLAYIGFEFVSQLLKAPRFLRTGNPTAFGSDLIGFTTIIVPLFLICGMIQRWKWTRLFAIGWFGIELLFNLVVVLSASAHFGRLLGVNSFTTLQFAGEALVLSYMISTRHFLDDHFDEPGVTA